MSLCRFSSNDFQCDLYVYASSAGYTLHLAATRVEFASPLPAPVELDAEHIQEWIERHNLVRDMLHDARRVPIRLPHAGETLTAAGPKELVALLHRLRELGYRFPDSVFEAVLDEPEY